ncbi:MAG: hypothetical protein PF517_19610 [Salinivirgaceae bacterium]|jgi:hypothetical protein|nr:hypothetical protein [Salinivirgaceae bacterium]
MAFIINEGTNVCTANYQADTLISINAITDDNGSAMMDDFDHSKYGLSVSVNFNGANGIVLSSNMGNDAYVDMYFE